MKKGLLTYTLCWILLLALFNVACFLTPDETAEYNKFGGAFWTGYVLITLMFIGHLICAVWAFFGNVNQKFFYRIPLIRVSYTGLIFAAIVGVAFMAIPNLPIWVGNIISFVVLTFIAFAVLKASLVANVVIAIDDMVKKETLFIKNKTIEAESLMNRAKTEEARTACKKVYEAFRYSDPMGNDALSAEEAKITLGMDELANAIDTEAANVSAKADEIVLLVRERNHKCQVLKKRY